MSDCYEIPGGYHVVEDADGERRVKSSGPVFKSRCHPEANGRQPQDGDTAWTLSVPLENGETLKLKLGKEGRDNIFGMIIADCIDSGEPEPH